MKTDLPKCRFKLCRYQLDGNCTNKIEYKRCEYISAIQTLELIMATQKFCALCNNDWCKNATTSEASCAPVWNGMRLKEE